MFSSSNDGTERFVDKQEKLKNLKNALDLLNEKFSTKFKHFTHLENLRTSIIKNRRRNEHLRELVKDKRLNIQRLQEKKKENHDKNRAQRIILPKYEDKVNKLGDYVIEAMEKNDSLRKKSQEQMEELKMLRTNHIEKLMKIIFPITQRHAMPNLMGLQKASNESLQKEMLPEIVEAVLSPEKHSSLCDYLVKEYIIAGGPALPSSGNYVESYCKWLSSNKDGNSEASQVAQNAAYRIVAGLSYLQQLVQVLSFFLDIRLPHKISCNDFNRMVLSEQQFAKKVTKLSFNVVYLAYMVHVPSRLIQPARTVENILQLLENENLGRTGAVQDNDFKSIDSIILSFTDLVDDDDDNDVSDFDSEDEVHKEWENVSPSISPLEVTQSAIPEASAMTTTIKNVAHSLWKGWK